MTCLDRCTLATGAPRPALARADSVLTRAPTASAALRSSSRRTPQMEVRCRPTPHKSGAGTRDALTIAGTPCSPRSLLLRRRRVLLHATGEAGLRAREAMVTPANPRRVSITFYPLRLLHGALTHVQGTEMAMSLMTGSGNCGVLIARWTIVDKTCIQPVAGTAFFVKTQASGAQQYGGVLRLRYGRGDSPFRSATARNVALHCLLSSCRLRPLLRSPRMGGRRAYHDRAARSAGLTPVRVRSLFNINVTSCTCTVEVHRYRHTEFCRSCLGVPRRVRGHKPDPLEAQ
jgi:hypothetical protein